MLRKFFFAFTFLFCGTLLFSQTIFPSYPEVLKNFFSRYSYQPENNEELRFAKKKDGWYIRIVDLTKNDSLLQEQLLWDLIKSSYEKVTGFNDPSSNQKIDSLVEIYLSPDLTYSFYGFERCRYYGYGSWAYDMIADFSNYHGNSDTLIEGLARAYSSYASGLLWDQLGDAKANDSFFTNPLKPLELPSEQRIDLVKKYLDLSISYYKKLEQLNPKYETKVGSASMKLFIEQMNGYLQMSLSRDQIAAKKYLESIQPDEAIIAVAKNYLNGCDPNAILFTFGDGDTFPLWYVQEMLNYRRDVSVINNSLLGFPGYVDLIKQQHTVDFSTTKESYGSPEFDLSAYDATLLSTKEKVTSLAEFIKTIQSRKYTYDGYRKYASYPWQKIILKIDTAPFKKVSKGSDLTNNIEWNLGSYVMCNDFLTLDIINTNLYKRPIYFAFPTDFHKQHLKQESLIYRFIPLNNKQIPYSALDVVSIETFLGKQLEPLLLPSKKSNSSILNNYVVYIIDLYSSLSDYYFSKGNYNLAGNYAKKAFDWYNGYPFPITNAAFTVSNILFKTKNDQAAISLLERFAEKIFELYQKPSPLYLSINKSMAIDLISYIKTQIKENNSSSSKIERIFSLLSND